jgi:hypothetical protein
MQLILYSPWTGHDFAWHLENFTENLLPLVLQKKPDDDALGEQK